MSSTMKTRFDRLIQATTDVIGRRRASTQGGSAGRPPTGLASHLRRLIEGGWMKMVLLSLSAVIIIVVLLAGGVILLADSYPFEPGNPLYGLQYAAESVRLELIS